MALIVEYKKDQNILTIIKEELYKLYDGKIGFSGPEPVNMVTIETGLSGFINIDKILEKERLPVTHREYDGETGGPTAKYTIPYLAKVTFRLDSLKDQVENDEYIDGFRKSSYSYTIKNADKKVLAELTIVE